MAGPSAHTASSGKIGTIARAALVVTQDEHGDIKLKFRSYAAAASRAAGTARICSGAG
jgi:hypothetical protein